MVLRDIFCRVVVGSTLIAGAAMLAAQSKADVTMRAATEQETVRGDLAGAIKMYEQVVKEAGADRALAAKALLRMAGGYGRLRGGQARKVYERLVREYGDQTDVAAMARARLSGSTTGSKNTRVVHQQ